jgi:adenine/guanine phosphoribosyltransferase-like PRPP-binding protein
MNTSIIVVVAAVVAAAALLFAATIATSTQSAFATNRSGNTVTIQTYSQHKSVTGSNNHVVQEHSNVIITQGGCGKSC